MADPPTPPPTPPSPTKGATRKGPRLPDSSRYPVLVSGQVSFTTAAAIKDIELVPQNVYRIQVDLRPRSREKTFKEAPWTLVARHFFSTLQLHDEKAIIVRKKANAEVNKISSPEELPDNPEIFERDYAYDVSMKSNRLVSFKMIVATTQPFGKTFREGPLYQKLVNNDWYVKYVRLESQGTVAEIGHLLYGHNRFVNQEELVREIRALIHPTICRDIDVTVTKAHEFFYENEKKVRTYTRWPTIICPIDIAPKLSKLLMEKWEDLGKDPKYGTFNLKNLLYIPNNKTLVPFDARINNIAKQNEFLRNYQDVTVIRNCYDIDADFTYTEEIAEIFGLNDQLGHVLSLRQFLQSWEDKTTDRSAIVAIYKTNNRNEYSLLTGKVNKQSIHNQIQKLVNVLKNRKKFKDLQVGGTKGTINSFNHSDKVKSYASKWFKTDNKYQQRPTSKIEQEENSTTTTMKEDEWKTPPSPRRPKKGPKQSTTIDYNDTKLIQLYSDMVKKPNAHNSMRGVNHGQMTAISLSGDTRDTALERFQGPDNKMNRYNKQEAPKMVEQQLSTTQQIQLMIKSRQFQETLAKIVAPQVSNLIEPTVKKINQIEEQVGELHDYVQDTNTWQREQTNRQNELKSDMTTMTAGMNMLQDTMQRMMKMQMEKEGMGGMKRPPPSPPTLTQPITSPSQRQRLQHQESTDQLITQDSDMNMNLDYQTSEMAHTPTQIIPPTHPAAIAEEQESAEEGGET